MKKVIDVALATKFGDMAAMIRTIAEATPNVETALEMLLGVYEEPTLPSVVIMSGTAETWAVLIEYRPLDRENSVVRYEYTRMITRYAKANATDIGLSNTKSYEDGDYIVSHMIEETGKDSCSLETWLKATPAEEYQL